MPHRHDHCSCAVSFDIGKCESSGFVLSQDCFHYAGPLNFHVNFGTSWSVSIEKPVGVWTCAWGGLPPSHENRSHGSTLCEPRRCGVGGQLGGPVGKSRARAGKARPFRSQGSPPRSSPTPEFLLLSLSPCWLRLDRYRLILFSRGKPLGHREVQ